MARRLRGTAKQEYRGRGDSLSARYRSNGTPPKMLANGTVRLRVVGESQHQNDEFDVRNWPGTIPEEDAGA